MKECPLKQFNKFAVYDDSEIARIKEENRILALIVKAMEKNVPVRKLFR